MSYIKDSYIFLITMSKLSQQLRKLDRKLVQEFASCNNITEDEASDLMADYDFMVDASQYDCSDFTFDQITKEEYDRLKNLTKRRINAHR